MKKKIKYLSIIFLFTFVLSSCGEAKPEEVVENTFKLFQENKLKESSDYFVKSEEDVDEDDEANIESMLELLNDFASENCKDISYEILDTKEDKNEATVKVKVKYKDASGITKIAFQEFLKQTISSAFTDSVIGNDDDLDDSQMMSMFLKAFENAQEKATLVSKSETLEIKCKKVDDEWKIDSKKEMINIYYCNIINTMTKLSDSTKSDDKDDSKEDVDVETTEEVIEEATETETTEETTKSEETKEAEEETTASAYSKDEVSYYQDPYSASYTAWNDSTELIFNFIYLGTNFYGQSVGDGTFTMNSKDENDNPTSETLEWTFVEDTDPNSTSYGTIYFRNGNTLDYSIYLEMSENVSDHYVLCMDMNGEEVRLVEAEWAHNNVG